MGKGRVTIIRAVRLLTRTITLPCRVIESRSDRIGSTRSAQSVHHVRVDLWIGAFTLFPSSIPCSLL